MLFPFRYGFFLPFCLGIVMTMSLDNSVGHHNKHIFKVYWNVPTFLCKVHNEDFEKTLEKFDIKHNKGDAFIGEEIAIFYKPGMFPIVVKGKEKSYTKKNKGIPQSADFKSHIEAFRKTLKKAFPYDFSGIGVIDFEEWRPIFRQNWNTQVIYRNLSIELAKKENPKLPPKKIEEIAAKKFEDAATKLMVKTLEEAKNLYPRASWGYYGFPYCYNHYSNDLEKCAKGVTKENDRIQKIFDKSQVLCPSIYVNETSPSDYKEKLIRGRLLEAKRVWENRPKKEDPFVLPYFWVKYLDTKNYFTDVDTEDTMRILKKMNMGGVIVWGASEDVGNKKKCQEFHNYVKKVLGPAIEKVRST